MNRIVSLIASATEIVAVLGELPHLVGRSHECDFPPEVKRLPCCTKPRIDVSANSREIDALVKAAAVNALSIYDVFDDLLEALQPTHILTQTQCDVCAVSLRDVEASVAAKLASRPRVVSLQPDSLAAIWDDIRRVAGSLSMEGRGEQVIASLQSRMRQISAKALTSFARPSVACIEWLEPLMAAGNWTPELIEMAGGINRFGHAGRHSPWMIGEELAAADPDIVIVAPCGFDLKRTRDEMYWLTGNPAFPGLKAARTGRVYLADGNQFFNRPGPRVVETLAIAAQILHPELFAPSLRGKGWARHVPTGIRDRNSV